MCVSRSGGRSVDRDKGGFRVGTVTFLCVREWEPAPVPHSALDRLPENKRRVLLTIGVARAT